MRFTPNDVITAKLTNMGQRRAIDAMDKFNHHMRVAHPRSCLRKSVPFNSDGVIKGQFWSVMQDIGGYSPEGAGGDALIEWIECNE